jgi:Concanavalin A-like lectin/glucanases superfamily
MKNILKNRIARWSTVFLMSVFAWLGLAPAARAGLTVNVSLYHDTFGYYFYPYLSEDTNLPSLPDGTYYVDSPQIPTNGSQQIFYETNNTLSGIGGGGSYYYDFASFIYGITNGQWSILFTNSVVTNQYFFTVSVSGITSNSYGAPVMSVFPVSGDEFVTNQPLFEWTGPTNWAGSLYVDDNFIDTNGYYDYEASANLLPNQTSWQSPVVLPDGTNDLFVQYSSNVTAFVVASIPTNVAHQAISTWTSTATMQTEFTYDPQFIVGPQPPLSGGHTLAAHYAFDESGDLGLDTSGNNNSQLGETYWGPIYSFSTDTEAGDGAVQFVGTSCLSMYSQTLTNIENVLAGSFTFSAWVNTTNSQGSDTDDAINGATIFWADNNRSGTNDAIPLSITGSKAAFSTRDDLGNITTIHSLTSVNDGNYHLITVTRDQPSGAMRMYVDGNFEAIALGTTQPLNANTNAYSTLSVGGWPQSSYTGLLDDLQIYSGALSDSEVAELYNNPGTTVSNISAVSGEFNDALGTTGLNWDTSGDTSWFVESTNTFNELPAAAQSGSVTNDQSSTITLTVNGPGTLTFEWSTHDDCNNFYCEYDIDGQPDYTYLNDIECSQPWVLNGPYTIPAGQHILTWTAYADGDTDPTEAAFLDQVTYTPANLPVITLNPFNQTNYPGYQVWLAASATNTPGVTWQWYEVGSGAIPDATTNYFIPTNSGTAGTVVQYYAVASTPAGSVDTTRATVTYMSGPLPPSWSTAFKSPFENGYTVFQDYYVTCVPDSLGNIYAAGDFAGTNITGPPNYISPNGTSADLVKQSATGSMLWTVDATNNGSGFSQSYGVALAPAGGVYVVGNYEGTNWLGTNILANLSQAQNPADSIFLARFDANGNNLWIRTISGTNASFVQYNDLVSDAAGNVTLSGACSGSTYFSSTNLATGTNLFAVSPQGVLAQYDTNGTLRWAEVTSNYINSMSYSANRLYGTIGNVSSSFNFNGISVSTDRAKSVVALRATNGSAIWVQGVGEPYSQPNPLNVPDNPIVTVSGTNVFIAGTGVGSNAAFGPYSTSWPGLANQFLARCDTNGTPLLITNFGSSTTFPRDIVADAKGNVYVDGEFDSYSIFGNDQLAAPIADRFDVFSQAFLAKFDVNGNPLWADEAVATGFVIFVGIGLDTNGVWACGVSESGYYPQLEPTLFGTNEVFSDGYYVSGGEGGSTTVIWQPGGVLAKINNAVVTGVPVKLLTLQDNGVNFQFSFTSQANFNHLVEYTTNLLNPNWQTYTNVAGDGTVKTIPIPLSVFSPSRQGFVRVSTQ